VTNEEMDKLINVYELGMGRRALALASGVSEKKAREFLEKRGSVKNAVLPKNGKTSVKGVAVSAFLSKMDYPARIDATVREYCADAFIAESDFRVLTKLNSNNFRQGVNSGSFDGNQFKMDGVVYWSTEKNIRKAKDMRGYA